MTGVASPAQLGEESAPCVPDEVIEWDLRESGSVAERHTSSNRGSTTYADLLDCRVESMKPTFAETTN